MQQATPVVDANSRAAHVASPPETIQQLIRLEATTVPSTARYCAGGVARRPGPRESDLQEIEASQTMLPWTMSRTDPSKVKSDPVVDRWLVFCQTGRSPSSRSDAAGNTQNGATSEKESHLDGRQARAVTVSKQQCGQTPTTERAATETGRK